ncbi:MAG TPA: hypothetical protein VGU43_00540 [Thermoplasmata archaeon]|nr:hypothetical protein [Thermoplasmata archaeon]
MIGSQRQEQGTPRWAGPLQWPLLGVVALLVLLLLLTPSLLSPGAPVAGSPATQAVLVVYREARPTPMLQLIVQGASPSEYTNLSIGISRPFAWPPANGGHDLQFFRWANASAAVFVTALDAPLPVAVNVSAIYSDPNGNTAYYTGLYAFNVTGNALVILTLSPSLAGQAPTSLPLADLPQPLPLALVLMGGAG